MPSAPTQIHPGTPPPSRRRTETAALAKFRGLGSIRHVTYLPGASLLTRTKSVIPNICVEESRIDEHQPPRHQVTKAVTMRKKLWPQLLNTGAVRRWGLLC